MVPRTDSVEKNPQATGLLIPHHGIARSTGEHPRAAYLAFCRNVDLNGAFMTVADTRPKTALTTDAEIPVVVADRRRVAAGVVQLRLAPAGGALPPWNPGAHIDLLLPDGLVRQYSLCGEPDETEWTIMVLREQHGRGGSAYVHDELRAGQQLVARGPRNHFALEQAPRYRFIAGGIGITPILSMLRAVETSGADWSLAYCGRTREGLAQVDELTSRYGARVQLHIDAEQGMPGLEALMSSPQPGELLYACGPSGMLDAIERLRAGWPKGSVHFERFTPIEQEAAGNTEFEVELAASGKVLTIPADRPIIDVVREAGVQVLSSCQEGTCGTCETYVLSGEIDHRDSVLSEEERDEGEVMMICVSRARCPRLVLDI
ncbi:Ferredoxin-NADP reductase [Actinomadura madurae]|uniref:Ferredoxin-NADP reductase n=1 Tax=Actinomadura madurae TaxID=1993 RepID=A0A1I5HYZ7_9ACTN|nr:Ferredoxin-NADP reductase [Actinomadura madurae]